MPTAPRLTTEKIDKALKLLDGWSGKLTWAKFLALLEVDVGHKYTKAALLRHARFKSHWDNKRWSATSNDTDKVTNFGNHGLVLANQKIKVLEETILRLQKDNELFHEKFVIWATNAVNKGITLEDLNRPIPVHSKKEFF